MKVAIIGSGNIGQALGATLVRSGHEVTIAARDAHKTAEVASAIGAAAANSAEDAVRDSDVVILAVPYASFDDVAAAITPAATGKVVIDVSNPLTPDYSGLATTGSSSAAEQLAAKVPGAHVVKAFNTVFGAVQAQPGVHGTPLDVLFATDDADARATVTELIESTGFRPVDAGSLAAASQLEALAFLNIRMQMQFGGDWQSAFVLLGAPAGSTATAPVPAGRR